MTVSTIFLQTTNEGDNEYGDTTFSIHVPAMDQSYKLQVAAFMFRPKIILMDDQVFDLTITCDIVPSAKFLAEKRHWDNDYTHLIEVTGRDQQLHYLIDPPVQFKPSKTEVTQMSELIHGTETFELPLKARKDTKSPWSNHTLQLQFNYDFIQWSLTADYRLQMSLSESHITSASYVNKLQLPCDLQTEDYDIEIIGVEIAKIGKELQYFSGLAPGVAAFSAAGMSPGTAPHTYNPHYWNYITLSCNKSYNTGNVVNQERFNTNIDESSQFYKGQILGYMPNNAYDPEAMQTGLATANEYLINPGDFNSIRFWLNYDNGEPVKLCSPMTIVLNMMPNVPVTV